MTSKKNAKLTPTKVPVRLPSGRTIQAVRHKNLVPPPAASTPPAGPVGVPVQAAEVDGLHRATRSEFDADGFTADGFDADGFDADGFDRDGFTAYGFDTDGFDRGGFDSYRIHRETGNRFGPASYDRTRHRGYSPDFDEEADRQMIHSVRGASEDDFPKGVDDGELVVRYNELLLAAAKEFPYDPIADTYIVGDDPAPYPLARYESWGAWGEIEDKCFWEAAMELSDRAAERKRKRDRA